jgi:hypothetical protein
MSKDSTAEPDEQILSEFRQAMAGWAGAVQAHKQAPPDLGFAARLAGLARGAGEAARVCRSADAAGFEWPPARKADSEPPYELRAGTGRRGPEELWRRFDQTITRLSTVAAGTDMLEVASAYEELAAIAGELAQAVAAEDRQGGARRSGRARGAA